MKHALAVSMHFVLQSSRTANGEKVRRYINLGDNCKWMLLKTMMEVAEENIVSMMVAVHLPIGCLQQPSLSC